MFGRREGRNAVFAAVTAAFTGCILAGGSLAASDPPWKVEGKLLGKQKDDTVKKSKDVSGIACVSGDLPRTCLVVDDETQGTQILILKEEGKLIAGQFILLINDTFEGKPIELDAEGVAHDGKSFYITGSHGYPRHGSRGLLHSQARAKASQKIFRIELGADAVDFETGSLKSPARIDSTSGLVEFIKAQSALAPSLNKPLDENGVSIEGIAAAGERIYAGFRTPVSGEGNAFLLSAPTTALFDSEPGEGKLHIVKLGQDSLGKARGVRDVIAITGGFLILAGPALDPPDDRAIVAGDYSIYRWDGFAQEATKLLDLDAYGAAEKPEALLRLDEKDGAMRALLLFDGAKEGGPRPVTINLR